MSSPYRGANLLQDIVPPAGTNSVDQPYGEVTIGELHFALVTVPYETFQRLLDHPDEVAAAADDKNSTALLTKYLREQGEICRPLVVSAESLIERDKVGAKKNILLNPPQESVGSGDGSFFHSLSLFDRISSAAISFSNKWFSSKRSADSSESIESSFQTPRSRSRPVTDEVVENAPTSVPKILKSILKKRNVRPSTDGDEFKAESSFLSPADHQPHTGKRKGSVRLLSPLLFGDSSMEQQPKHKNRRIDMDLSRDDWQSGESILGFCWHPTQNKIAIALKNHCIKFYNWDSNRFEADPLATQAHKNDLVLTHQFMTNIRTIKYNPVAGYSLAVVCKYGVALWKFSLLGLKKSPAYMIWLRYDGHNDVSDVEFSPCGRFAAVSSHSSLSLNIWHLDKGAHGANLIGTIGGVRLIKWSPTGELLFTADVDAHFRVWDTTDWSNKLWKTGAPVDSASWSPNGTCVLVASRKSSLIHVVNLLDNVASLQNQTVINVTYNPESNVGGLVYQIAWSPTGERLAVSFTGTHPGSELIALFACRPDIALTFQAIGFIRGPPSESQLRQAGYRSSIPPLNFDEQPSPAHKTHTTDEIKLNKPVLMQFCPHFNRGALLTVCWSAGQVWNYPLYFEDRHHPL